jgi:hypothetical protein
MHSLHRLGLLQSPQFAGAAQHVQPHQVLTASIAVAETAALQARSEPLLSVLRGRYVLNLDAIVDTHDYAGSPARNIER